MLSLLFSSLYTRYEYTSITVDEIMVMPSIIIAATMPPKIMPKTIINKPEITEVIPAKRLDLRQVLSL